MTNKPLVTPAPAVLSGDAIWHSKILPISYKTNMLIAKIENLPDGLTKSNREILMTGSGGNHHTYENGEFYLKRLTSLSLDILHQEQGVNYYTKDTGRKTKMVRHF